MFPCPTLTLRRIEEPRVLKVSTLNYQRPGELINVLPDTDRSALLL